MLREATRPIRRPAAMVGVAQLVRAPGCGPGCRGFESHRSPPFHDVPGQSAPVPPAEGYVPVPGGRAWYQGCGHSDRPGDDSLWILERFVEELAAVREALGLDRMHLFGNSWGGWLALQYVLDRRPSLNSLILSSSPPSVRRWISDCAGLRAALDPAVQDVLDRHEASGYFSCPEYQWA